MMVNNKCVPAAFTNLGKVYTFELRLKDYFPFTEGEWKIYRNKLVDYKFIYFPITKGEKEND